MFIIYRREKLSTRILKFWKPFAVSFVVLFVSFNWQSVSWLFNYGVASQYLSNLAPQNKLPAQAALAEAQEGLFFTGNKPAEVSVETTVNPPEEVKTNPVSNKKTDHAPATPVLANKISIPKIGITAPIVISDTADNNLIHKYLDKGVVMYPGSTVPGSAGETMLLGHSAPPGWPNIKYDWVFTKINQLQPGDTVSITFGNQVHSYAVTKTVFLERGEELPGSDLSKNTLFLISCWPPGKDLKRIAVEAVLQN